MRDEGLYSLLRLKQEIRDMESHITRLEVEKAELESERDRLLNDPDYLERIARERFRMAKPGEKVFHVVTETKRDGVRNKWKTTKEEIDFHAFNKEWELIAEQAES